MKATDTHGRAIELTQIGDDCYHGDCPAVSRTDRDTAAVQGYVLHAADMPDGEGLVETPIALLVDAVRALGYTVA